MIDLYPPRLFRVERRAIRSRIVIVVRRRRERGFDWSEAIRRAA